ncbi:MAG: N-acetylmuramoyl-L-alanine amidase [Eubacteriales bacterium]
MEKLKIKNGIIECMMVALLLSSMFVLSKSTAHLTNQYYSVSSTSVVEKGKLVVLDAGHGGNDPGKIGVNGAVEKEINLAITLRVKSLLEANDVTVLMTRESDVGLYEEEDDNKKVVDLKNRIQIMNEAVPDIIVSVHQNSYEEETIRGAQTFYYETSKVGQEVAELFQENLVKDLDPTNHRVAKGNDTYYILKETTYPIVIVECGFLSNWEEADLLITKEYQEKIAWSLHLSILQYLNQ